MSTCILNNKLSCVHFASFFIQMHSTMKFVFKVQVIPADYIAWKIKGMDLWSLNQDATYNFITTCPFGQVKYKFNEKHLPEWHFNLPQKNLFFVVVESCMPTIHF